VELLCRLSLKLYSLSSFIGTDKDKDEVPVFDFKKT